MGALLHAESSAIGCNAEPDEIKFIIIIHPINELGLRLRLRLRRIRGRLVGLHVCSCI